MSLTIESSRFGRVEIDPGSVIEFPDGLIGLSGSRYALHGKSYVFVTAQGTIADWAKRNGAYGIRNRNSLGDVALRFFELALIPVRLDQIAC